MSFPLRALYVSLMACLIGCTSPLASAQERSPALEQLTVVSFNVQNAFDVFDNPYTEDESTAAKSRKDMERVAASIRALDADVVAFQEVENEYILAQMVAEFLPDSGYRYVAAAGSNDGRGITNGIVSRLPINRIVSYRHRAIRHPDDPEDRVRRISRDLMHVTLELGGDRKLELFNVHLKSNRTVEDGDQNAKRQRTAEALALRGIIGEMLTEKPDTLVLAVGDFNSDYMRRPEDNRDWPAMEAMLADTGKATTLTDVHAALPRAKRISLPSKGEYPPAVFDFILASPQLARRVVTDSPRVLFDPELNGGSDHRPIVATFDLTK